VELRLNLWLGCWRVANLFRQNDLAFYPGETGRRHPGSRACKPGGPLTIRVAENGGRSKALADVIGFAASTAKGFNEHPEFEDDVRLEFTFDSRIESNGTGGTLYKMLANAPEWTDTGIFDTKIQFEGGPGKNPRLEMGDLLARESMKELDRKITNARPNVRGARVALEETQKFKFIERGQQYWENLHAFVQKPKSVELLNEFNQWLIKRGNVHSGKPTQTPINWFTFLAWKDSRM
jgi:hypothetical protein